MDPNKAFESILRGHMVAEHAEALSEWLRRGGFDPEPRFIPVDCHPIFGEFRKDIDIKATMFGVEDIFDNLLVSWSELEGVEDAQY